jgi:hypothetical protein
MSTILDFLDPLGLGFLRTITIKILVQGVDTTRDYPEAAVPDRRRGQLVSTSCRSWQLPARSSGALPVGR